MRPAAAGEKATSHSRETCGTFRRDFAGGKVSFGFAPGLVLGKADEELSVLDTLSDTKSPTASCHDHASASSPDTVNWES
jgi:hypothetical protein